MIFSKNMKIGLPQFSNVDIGFSIEVEAEEGEKIDEAKCWDHVNRQLYIQTSGLDPSWIVTKEFNNFFRVEVKVPKNGGKK